MMIRAMARLFLLACLALGALAPEGLARTEEGLVWREKATQGLVSLAYGPADQTKAPLFLLSCFNAMDIAVLDVRTEIADASPGDALTIELSAGGAKSPLSGEATRDHDGATFGEASDIEVKPVLDVLRQSGPMTITIGENSATLSDQGRAEATDTFSRNCKVD
jgi:hypothetical protein